MGLLSVSGSLVGLSWQSVPPTPYSSDLIHPIRMQRSFAASAHWWREEAVEER